MNGWIDLSGRVALVIGGGGGIGGAACALIAEAGATVVVLDRDDAAAEARAAAIRAAGGSAEARALDVASEADWGALRNWLQGRWGRLDILVNCAGIARFDKLDEAIAPTYREVFAVNLDGVVFGMAMALGFMRAAGHGAIVNVSSTAALKGNPAMASYGASKAGVVHFTRSAARETNLAGLDIRVNAVLPGFTDTAMAEAVHQRFDDELGGREATLKLFASGRPAQPEEIANLILFLVSDRASFISGSIIAADRAQGA